MKTFGASVCIIGSPNTGKSTLLNRILGKRISIVSDRPQTTRSKILGILTKENRQLIFIDTPGVGRPIRAHAARLNRLAQEAQYEADLILFMLDAKKGIGDNDRKILHNLKSIAKPKIAAINKMDLSSNEKAMPVAQELFKDHGFQEIFPLSAKLGYNVEALLDKLFSLAPENPLIYGEKEWTTQTDEQMISEYVREQVFLNADKELPYSVRVRLEALEKTADGGITARAALLAENVRHRRILIGEGGSFIRNVRLNAQRRLRQYFGAPVHLALFVQEEKELFQGNRQ